MPGLKQHHLKTRANQAFAQPLRQRTCLKTNPAHRKPEIGKMAQQRLRFACHLRLTYDFARRIHHTHAAVFSDTSIPA